MLERSITDFANDAVKELATIGAHCELLSRVNAYEVSVEDDTLAIINFDGEDLFMEVHMKEFPAIGRTILRPTYVPGYYKHHHGGYWEPPEVEDVPLDDASTVLEAVSQLISVEWMFRMQDILEAESYADAGDIFEEIA